MEKKVNISCVILAGGKNSRNNGNNKAFIKIDNKFIIDRILEVVEPIFSEILIITNNKDEFFNYSKYDMYSDLVKDIGPLGGIYTALNYIKTQAAFIISCDMPYLSSELISIQLSKYIEESPEIIVPIVDDYAQPLHSIYSKKIYDKLNNYIATTDNFKIRNFYSTVDTYYWKLESSEMLEKAFTNINKI